MTTSRGILFKDAMVRALRATPPKTETRRTSKLKDVPRSVVRFAEIDSSGVWEGFNSSHRDDEAIFAVRCPYGTAGDELWVKEVFTVTTNDRVMYRADLDDDEAAMVTWTSSLLMPRALSRIDLVISSVRVNLLQAIDDEGVHREGFTCREDFVRTIDEINGEGTFDANPWVWVVTFEEVKRAAR